MDPEAWSRDRVLRGKPILGLKLMQDPAHKSQVPSMPPGGRAGGGRSYVLRFISGKYQGGEFPIVNDKPIIVGRSSDLDMEKRKLNFSSNAS